ncbi:MAG: hypothetical protein EAZ55_02815 [Cytophagales bacterium]|nr:MAG: hypothetical protein EAZ55_02815 [Cytophagales bacterium]
MTKLAVKKKIKALNALFFIKFFTFIGCNKSNQYNIALANSHKMLDRFGGHTDGTKRYHYHFPAQDLQDHIHLHQSGHLILVVIKERQNKI